MTSTKLNEASHCDRFSKFAYSFGYGIELDYLEITSATLGGDGEVCGVEWETVR
jgi:hypothetical protein